MYVLLRTMITCVYFTVPSLHKGGRVVHSYGRLIPREFPITDLQQISGPDRIGRITCTVSSGTAWFIDYSGQLRTGGVSETRNGTTATLVVNPSNVDSFQNTDLYCTNYNNVFYLYISSKYTYSTISNVGSFWDRELYCTNVNTNFFYLSISSASKYTYSTIFSAHSQHLANRCWYCKHILKMLSF